MRKGRSKEPQLFTNFNRSRQCNLSRCNTTQPIVLLHINTENQTRPFGRGGLYSDFNKLGELLKVEERENKEPPQTTSDEMMINMEG